MDELFAVLIVALNVDIGPINIAPGSNVVNEHEVVQSERQDYTAVDTAYSDLEA
jgi:hypothetical protein